MALSEKELEKQLMEAGKALLSPPSSASELLPLLDRVERFLTRVEQSPSESMKKALSPSTKALIAKDLLRHSDVDVKVSVASCISEITRITAPDAPYDDDQMKEVFQLIVSSFEKLDDTNSPSYIKRTSILETVAKVRSCVVMLDLECDALIYEMFQHFFRSIRDYHSENVFSSMETIMTLVLEESEDISVDLLSSILDFLKIQDKEVLPIARQLAENVIEKCANKLKPYLVPAVKSRGASVNDYCKVVANVCQMGSEAVEPGDGDAASKNLGEESDLANAPTEKAVEVAMETLDDAPPSEEVGPATAGSPKSVMSNGNLQKDIEETSAIHDDSKDENHDANDGVEAAEEPTTTNAESVDAEELAKSDSKPEKSNKRKARKISSSRSTPEPSEPPLMDNKEVLKDPEHEEKDSKDADSAQIKGTVDATVEPAENETGPGAEVSSPRKSENEPADVPSPSPSGSLDENHLKKSEQPEKKEDLVQETELAGDADSKKESDTKKTTQDTSVSESKSQKRMGKKASSAAEKDDSVPLAVDTSKKKHEDTPKVDTKSVKQSGKKVEAGSSQREDKKKKGQAKGTPAKDLAKTPSRDEAKKPAPQSTAKSSKDESDVEKTSKAGSKRKQSPGEEKASDTKVYGAELVGSKIKVWWPADKTYYEGIVESFDPVKIKHKIVYIDGDVEILKLAKERWKLLDDDTPLDQGHASDAESPDESAETPKAKKGKTNADQGSKRGKTETTARKGGASSSKSKPSPKSVRKQKDDNKAETKSKEESSKSVGKSDENKAGKSKDIKAGNKSSAEAPKSDVKSKDDDVAPRGANKSKQETPKGATKSKGKTPKASAKSNSSGTGKGKASTSSKEVEAEDAEESPEPTKAPETTKAKSPSTTKSQKSGKKRKRGGKG